MENKNMLQKLFGFNSHSMQVRTEILAGITTFLTMSYILAVNPSILGVTGMDKGAVFTATATASLIATLIMAVWAKLPFALAPGMGLNAFFAFTVCLGMGNTWEFALTAVLIEGLLFILLTLSNLREAILNAIPDSLKNAIGAGIGLFIAFIGLQNAGVITKNDATLVTLGNITSGSPLLALIGLAITSVLLIKKVKGSMLWGILLTMLIGIPMGITEFNGIVSIPPSLEPVFFKFDFSKVLTTQMVFTVFTLLFIDMFDTIGTLVGVSNKAGMLVNGKVPRAKQAFMADAIGTTVGAMLGTNTVSTFVESASGIAQGGRSGITSFVTAICFGIALLFAPLFLSIPSAATCPILVLVGLFMMSPIKDIDLDDFTESVPAFICIIMIPMAYSISDGIVLGLISYVLTNLLSGKFKKISLTMYILAALFTLKYLV
ncbi:NCS2 family permease [Bacteroides sp. M27]|uniref:NCS2 family permease n=2 Tax=Bacteroides difficilis TaxID=2763021 RepID=A0ABR7C7F2_9BACE|nr:NCS2 family permease [Bacteroides difficilis]MBC5603726.1 NCS2 family permease [Bacteroides difficilis]